MDLGNIMTKLMKTGSNLIGGINSLAQTAAKTLQEKYHQRLDIKPTSKKSTSALNLAQTYSNSQSYHFSHGFYSMAQVSMVIFCVLSVIICCVLGRYLIVPLA